MRRRIMCACIALTALGCSSPNEPEPGWFAGSVVARDVTISIGDPPSIHVREGEGDECGIVFLVRPSTMIIRDGRSPLFGGGNYSDLSVGTTVRVAAAIVLDSCPGQSVAKVIEIES